MVKRVLSLILLNKGQRNKSKQRQALKNVGYQVWGKAFSVYSLFSECLPAVLFIIVEILTSPFEEGTSLILHKVGEKQETEKQLLSTM